MPENVNIKVYTLFARCNLAINIGIRNRVIKMNHTHPTEVKQLANCYGNTDTK